MEWPHLIRYAVVALPLSGLLWATFISEFPQAFPWRRRREQFLGLAEKHGFKSDREQCVVSKEVGVLPLVAGIRAVRYKSTSIQLFGDFPIPDSPDKLFISMEGSIVGMARAFGVKELTVGDPEFDAVFWVTCANEDEMREFLTLERRQAILYWLPRIPGARICDGKVTAEVTFRLPNFMAKTFEPLLLGIEGLARSLQGEPAPQEKDSGLLSLELMQRKFAKGTLLVWTVIFTASLALDSPGPTPDLLRVGSALMFFLTFGLYRGLTGCRLLLQGLYAFLSLVCTGLLAIGALEAAEILPGRWLPLKEDELLPLLLLFSPATLYFWGCRHHLKTLNASVMRSRGL